MSQIKETENITWIAPSKCSKRDAEVQNNVKDKPVTLSLEQQMVKLASTEEPPTVDTSTDLQLQWALQRRGLAFDQCALITNNEHEVWVQQLLTQMTREPPTGFSRVTSGQILRADRELFTVMAQELQGSLQPTANGELPMEKKLKELRNDPRITMFLLPMPRGGPKETEKPSSSTPTPKPASGGDSKAYQEAEDVDQSQVDVPCRVKELWTKGWCWQHHMLGVQLEKWLQERGDEWKVQERDALLHQVSQD